MTAQETVRELMTQYNRLRAAWIRTFGTDAGFDDWFTDKVFNI